MSPAFSSPRQAAFFALLLAALLASPWLARETGALASRREIYGAISWRTGGFPYIQQQIFDEKSDIDIAFIGSSHMYHAIDTPYFEQQLSARLGRPAVVRTLGYFNSGDDGLYFIARDLLAHRKVNTIVMYDDRAGNIPHLHAWQWIRFGDDASDLAGLPLDNRLAYYYGAILGLPRNLLSLVRPNGSLAREVSQCRAADDHEILPSTRLGTYTSLNAYNKRPDLFRPYAPPLTDQTNAVVIDSPAVQNEFAFAQGPPAELQSYFATKLVTLAQAHQTRLVCLNIPTYENRHLDKIEEGSLWSNVLAPAQIPLLGIAPERLFQGLDEAQIKLLYHDVSHLNANGQAFFTRVITPRLLDWYGR